MSEKIFLGIGAGPIQTGIFVAGVAVGNYDRIVLADVDEELVAAVKATGTLTINTATKSAIKSNIYKNIEIYNPNVKADLEILTELASKALSIAIALPSTKFYKFCIPWIKEGVEKNPDAQRYIYTAENSTTAAKEFKALLGDFPNCYVLDTVIGKMSKVFTSSEADLPLLASGIDRGHLFEEFNTIYTSNAEGIEDVNIDGLFPKNDLYPFEEAKLYGHNAVHLMMGIMASDRGCTYMSEAVKYPEIMETIKVTLIDECGKALCEKYSNVDDFFLMENFSVWAIELIERMTSPLLKDSIDRVIRNLDLKMSWDDRIIGTIRLCLAQGVNPKSLISIAKLISKKVNFEEIIKKWPNNQDAENIKNLLQ
jgi:hypothetical protein